MDKSFLNDRLGFTVDELCEAIPCGRTKLYEEARAGKIRLRKIGNKTICTVPDALEYMQSLPVADLAEPEAA
ncbi:MAG: DNA-binding protein [Pseudomonadota bacterium]